MKDELKTMLQEVYGPSDKETRVYFAPGRVNLIGEHTDYNGGHVFPCALTIGTYAAVRPNDQKVLRLYSANYPGAGISVLPLGAMRYDPADGWCNYPKGVIKVFADRGMEMTQGLDIIIEGTIPNGSGLSSSASLEVLIGTILLDQFGWQMDGVTLSLAAQEAENKFVGVNCGIMDQFAIAMGLKDHAIFLDTADLTYQYVPLALEEQGLKLVIACSNKKRGLADSKYNERRAECEAALEAIQTVRDVRSLGELSNEEFEQVASVIGDPVRIRRARHAVTENRRTISAVKALQQGDLKQFGELMNASHVSLRDDYEVTGIELDTLVEAAWQQPGVLGSRMTGAGFGGCTVSLVREEAVEAFVKAVGAKYRETIGYAADFYVVSVGSGPSRIG
ncbi:MAG: galactokinase [Firmicutes bacterium]|nr:galactokinase [Bacillota bacterium]